MPLIIKKNSVPNKKKKGKKEKPWGRKALRGHLVHARLKRWSKIPKISLKNVNLIVLKFSRAEKSPIHILQYITAFIIKTLL